MIGVYMPIIAYNAFVGKAAAVRNGSVISSIDKLWRLCIIYCNALSYEDSREDSRNLMAGRYRISFTV